MPIDLTRIPQPLIAAVAGRNLIPLIGAGISKQSESKSSEILPDWSELISEIGTIASDLLFMDERDEDLIEQLILKREYLVAAQALKDHIGDDTFEVYMRRRFQHGVSPGRIHRSLFKLRALIIMTTNYDLLLEEACVQELKTAAIVATPNRTYEVFTRLKTPWEGETPVIFKLHGTILDPSSIVLGERDYYRVSYDGSAYRLALQAIFMTKVVLMTGFSFSDPDIATVLGERKAGVRGDFIVMPRGERDRLEVKRLRSTFGVDLIEYEPSGGHSELAELIEYLARFVA